MILFKRAFFSLVPVTVVKSANGLMELHAEFFGFAVKGEVLVSESGKQSLIKWTNGMTWSKIG